MAPDAANSSKKSSPATLRTIWDIIVTLVLWTYFTLGFVVLFAPFYLLAALTGNRRETVYQHLNHLFFKSFIGLIRLLIPGHQWEIDPKVRAVRSAVIVSNHRSYLDPLILISLYPRQKTIVKSWLFSVPIFGQLMQWSGYIPSNAEGKQTELILKQMASLGPFLDKGGNLFIFPEGTRSRDGRINPLHSSAFKIARRCGVPIRVLFIKNTEKAFAPGRFRFNTKGPLTISVHCIDEIAAHEWSRADSLKTINLRVKEMLERHNRQTTAGQSSQQKPRSRGAG